MTNVSGQITRLMSDYYSQACAATCIAHSLIIRGYSIEWREEINSLYSKMSLYSDYNIEEVKFCLYGLDAPLI